MKAEPNKRLRFIPRNLSFDDSYHIQRACNQLLRKTLSEIRSDTQHTSTEAAVVINSSVAACAERVMEASIDKSCKTCDTDETKNSDFDHSESEVSGKCGDLRPRAYSSDSDNFSEDYTEVKEYDNGADCFATERNLSEKLNKLSVDMDKSDDNLVNDQDAESDAGSSESGVTLKMCDHRECDMNGAEASNIGPSTLSLNIVSSENEGTEIRRQGSLYDDDQEFHFLATEPVRRSVSLKTTKTPPGTPHRKKAVRFADVLGLDLESVRHIMNIDVPPKIPASATADLSLGIEEERRTQGSRYLTACFGQPGAASNFLARVIDQKVSLENCVVDDQELTVTGTVRVANIAFHKSVKVRYTTNNWLTFTDVTANYMANSCDGATDRFAFSIVVPQYFGVRSRLLFAVCYTVNGETFWDNNHGSNYIIECYARSFPTVENDNTWVHFL